MRVLIAIMLFCATQVFASVDLADVEDFDADTGLYFRPISEALPKAKCFSCDARDNDAIVNLFIYDPAKKTGRNLFHKSPGTIENIIVESAYDSKEKKMLFLGEAHIKNNQNIRARKPNNQFLIESYICSEGKHCLYTIWKSGKMGGEPKVLFTFSDSDKTKNEWHFDVKNNVVRLLTKKDASYTVEEFSW